MLGARMTFRAWLLCAGTLGIIGRQASGQAVEQTWYGDSGRLGWGADFGSSVVMMGDVDNDGFLDALIGAPRALDKINGVDVGRAFVKSGKDASTIYEFVGPTKGDIFGETVAAGDFDGDGVPDCLVGAPWDDQGKVYAYSGSTGALMYLFQGEKSADSFGFSLSGPGDLDGDGRDDLAIGAPEYDRSRWITQSGRVYVYSGGTGALLYTIDGVNLNEYLGVSNCSISDLDGDGRAEIGAGSPSEGGGSNGQGAFHVYSGATGALIYSLDGENHGDRFGQSSAGLGDVNGDGMPEFAVAAPIHQNNFVEEGRVYVYSGATAQLVYAFDGEATSRQLGYLPLVGDMDLNKDGFADIFVGSPRDDSGGAVGSVYCYSGRTGRSIYQFRGRKGSPTSDEIGSAFSNAFDFNGDGFQDVLIGAPGASDNGGSASGKAYVFGGNDLFLQANQQTYLAGDSLTIGNRGGAPGALTTIVVTDVNGTPMFLPLAFGALDGNGEFLLSGTVPPGLAGLTLTFVGYALKASGKGIADSISETVSFQ